MYNTPHDMKGDAMATRQLRPKGSDRLIAVRQVTIMLAALAIVIGLSTVAAFGQTTGIIVGRVIDTSGAVVSGAAVTAKNNSTGIPNTSAIKGRGFHTLVN